MRCAAAGILLFLAVVAAPASVATEAPAAAAPPEAPRAKAEFLERIRRGEVAKEDLEIVIAQYEEDISWSDAYSALRTVYCKGGANCAVDSVRLENVGREGHTFLYHIVHNYDRLAKWTVFTQAGEPSGGYKGHQKGGGHMLTGADFEDYLVSSQSAEDAFFLMSSKVHLPTLQHSLRSSFEVREGQRLPEMPPETPPRCPAAAGSGEGDEWGPYEEVPWLHAFLSQKCGVQQDAVGDAALLFWDTVVGSNRPPDNIVHYAQGARFAASRERIQQRPRVYYERLLQLLSGDTDPCLNYLFEWAWYYMIGMPQAEPCVVSSGELARPQTAPHAPASTSGAPRGSFGDSSESSPGFSGGISGDFGGFSGDFPGGFSGDFPGFSGGISGDFGGFSGDFPGGSFSGSKPGGISGDFGGFSGDFPGGSFAGSKPRGISGDFGGFSGDFLGGSFSGSKPGGISGDFGGFSGDSLGGSFSGSKLGGVSGVVGGAAGPSVAARDLASATSFLAAANIAKDTHVQGSEACGQHVAGFLVPLIATAASLWLTK